MSAIMPCIHCKRLPLERKEITKKGDNLMYVYEINHECGGINKSHLTLFFKNNSDNESCEKLLNESAYFYRNQWNNQNNIDKIIGM